MPQLQQPPKIVREGFLLTKSDRAVLGSDRKWVRHFFVLDNALHLSFFRADKLVGQIALVKETSVEVYSQTKHSFCLKTPFVSLYCQTSDDDEREAWIDALKQQVKLPGDIHHHFQQQSAKTLQPVNPASTHTISNTAGSTKVIKSSATDAAPTFTNPSSADTSSTTAPSAISSTATTTAAVTTTTNQDPPKKFEGTHSFVANNTKFEIDSRYEFKRVLGQGAYGVVIAVTDHETQLDVAIKKVQNVLQNNVDSKRILREIQIMRFLQSKKICTLISLMKTQSESWESFNDVYIVMPLMDTDLHHIIYSQQKLTDQHLQYLLFQLLSAVHYLESAKIVHRDLKPANILVNAACQLRICDFGLARALDQQVNTDPTIYVVTRWYRAPELLCGCTKYTSAIDIWSVGCIFAEMLGRAALFPGKNYLDQLEKIMHLRGSFSESDLASYQKNSALDERTVKFLATFPNTPKLPLREVPAFAQVSDPALDMLDKLLSLDWTLRLTALQAIKHAYLGHFSQERLESCHDVFKETNEIDERVQHTREALRGAIIKEIKMCQKS
ncbi:hypothetical protein BASA81_012510 [Batrachochytrium salamandrivorans]|nr:hypothetical protein BASA81_012510 [Batrachochytrium salamandrivorans]